MHTLIRGLPEILSELINIKSPEEIWDKIETITKSGKKGYPEILSSYNNLHMICPKTSRVLALGGILAANYLVTRTNFPELYENSPCSQLDWKNLISALIFRHAVQMVANGQSGVAVTFIDKPYEFLTLADVWKQPQHLRKRLLHRFREIDANFAGMYPYLSLCNHSCEPSLRLNFDGSRLIAKARNDLKKGDEVFNSYVLDCRNNSRHNRQEELKSIYQFECDCKHCQIGNNDNEFMKFHQYRCSAPNCNKVFSPPQTQDLRWWLVIEENNEILIKCPKCKTALEVDWYIKFEDLFMAEVLDSARLTEAFRLFKYSEKLVHGFNDLRNHMAWKIVTSFFEIWEDDVVINEKFFEEVANVLNYWLNHVEEQNDVESILYATTSTFALDLMAEGKCFNFDTKKIRRSFDMLSTELKNIFENYIQDYIGDKFDDASRSI
ncbi:uncharacterized protein LOC129911987 [Episyrphus balteatus]|uniref:uncharacterized protein LOC129911987 n=1 Tax=Episyrphus balteatus TaxID=286459 RepID=UPI002485CEC6|nr:uncharacterized protein LOC129911987 [Episyrphus balteatus]